MQRSTLRLRPCASILNPLRAPAGVIPRLRAIRLAQHARFLLSSSRSTAAPAVASATQNSVLAKKTSSAVDMSASPSHTHRIIRWGIRRVRFRQAADPAFPIILQDPVAVRVAAGAPVAARPCCRRARAARRLQAAQHPGDSDALHVSSTPDHLPPLPAAQVPFLFKDMVDALAPISADLAAGGGATAAVTALPVALLLGCRFGAMRWVLVVSARGPLPNPSPRPRWPRARHDDRLRRAPQRRLRVRRPARHPPRLWGPLPPPPRARPALPPRAPDGRPAARPRPRLPLDQLRPLEPRLQRRADGARDRPRLGHPRRPLWLGVRGDDARDDGRVRRLHRLGDDVARRHPEGAQRAREPGPSSAAVRPFT